MADEPIATGTLAKTPLPRSLLRRRCIMTLQHTSERADLMFAHLLLR
jgi:hypothetical protein